MSIDLGRAVPSPPPPGEVLEVKRRAVVVARGGALGAGQTLTTIQHLISAWHNVEDWDTVIVAPRDPHVTQLIDGLGGDLTVEREGADVAGIVAAAAREGRTASVFFAGDAVPALPHPAPLSVALVDVMGCDAAGVFGASLTSSHPAHDGEGLLTWERAVDPDVRQPVVVFTNASLHEAPRYRAAHKVAWLVESPRCFRRPRASPSTTSTSSTW